MKKYTVKENVKGVVMVVETPYKAGQTIVDNGKSPKISQAIAKLLALENTPIEEVGSEVKQAIAETNKLLEQQQEQQKTDGTKSKSAKGGA